MAMVTDASGVPRTIAANRATRSKGCCGISALAVTGTGTGALPRTFIFALPLPLCRGDDTEMVTFSTGLCTKRGLGLQCGSQAQNTRAGCPSRRVGDWSVM